MKNHYFIEMTDTFGGEANYCWVHRFIVSASTTCFFVEWIDAADIADYQDRYLIIEVL